MTQYSIIFPLAAEFDTASDSSLSSGLPLQDPSKQDDGSSSTPGTPTFQNVVGAAWYLLITFDMVFAIQILIHLSLFHAFGNFSIPDLNTTVRAEETTFQHKVPSLMVDVTGQTRKKKVILPSYLQGKKLNTIPNKKVKIISFLSSLFHKIFTLEQYWKVF